MKRRRISDWPEIRVNVNPRTLERIEAQAEQRALPMSVVIREALDRYYGQRAV
jgi:Ribbon-helix-helix protein, copG family